MRLRFAQWLMGCWICGGMMWRGSGHRNAHRDCAHRTRQIQWDRNASAYETQPPAFRCIDCEWVPA